MDCGTEGLSGPIKEGGGMKYGNIEQVTSGPLVIPADDPAQHEPGAKLDSGKIRPALVLGGFARALAAVSAVGTFGAEKYSDNGWVSVSNGQARYSEAMLRHWLAESGEERYDPESELLHAAHLCWNALARLDLMLRETE